MPSSSANVTLNPLPNSILIPSSRFTGKYIGTLASDLNQAQNIAYIWFGTSGDLTNDGSPEIVFSGWSFRGWNPKDIPPDTPLVIFSAGAESTKYVDPKALFGINSLPGTATPTIMDLDRNGRNDFFFLGHNESPFYPTTSMEFLQQSDGTFKKIQIAGPKVTVHNDGVGDFNKDGFPDIVASAVTTDKTYLDPAFFSYGGPEGGGGILMLYLNNGDGTFTPYGLGSTKKIDGYLELPRFAPGSAATIADFDNDGKSEIVVIDAWVDFGKGMLPAATWLISDINFGVTEAWGKLTELPKPYFDKDSRFADLASNWPDHKSHSIKTTTVDLNNDGLLDLMISSIVWDGTKGNSAGVMQILLNKGGLSFEDVTDKSLFNFYLGAGSSHQIEMMDVNHDGFQDIILPDIGNFDPVSQNVASQTWANRLLINAGNGKFVDAMWNEFHELTSAEFSLKPPGSYMSGIFDQKFIPYMLPDGRLGFVTPQAVYIDGVWQTGFFDFRANQALSTGPNGIDPASKGAPGYSEYYYLTQYPEVVEAINAGKYENGLDHYLKVGKANGYFAFAPNASIHDANSNDTLIGREGAEIFAISGGNDLVDGKDGIDTVVYSQGLSNYRISLSSNGYQIQDKKMVDGLDTLQNVEVLKFTDFTMNLTVKNFAKSIPTSALQKIEELYVAFFNRTPDADGLAYWIGEYKKGVTIDKIAETFYAIGASSQFASLTGFSTSMTNNDFINLFYKNVLGRVEGADTGGLAYWSGKLSNGSSTRSSLAADILNAAHTFKGDKDFGWVANLLDNKVSVANKIAIDWGLNFVSDAYTHGVAIAAAVTPNSIDAAITLLGISPLDLQIT